MNFTNIRLLGQPSRVNSRKECDTSTNICGISFSVPVIAPPMTSIISHDLVDNMELAGVGAMQPRMDTPNFIGTHYYSNRMFINSSIDTAIATAELLDKSDAKDKILSIEVNNGYMHKLADKIKEVKDKYPDIPIFAGAVFTPDGVEFLGEAGADVVLVGVGVSTVCTTTNKTGMGLPIVDTLARCANSPYPLGVLGGIREIGDVAKAIVLGADIVYIGHLLKGCKDAASKNEYWGMASKTEKGFAADYIEGKSVIIDPQQYYSYEIVAQIKQGLQGAMSMSDSVTLTEFRNKCKFTSISNG